MSIPANRAVIHWFRRDFRIRDNFGLLAACEGSDAVLGLFVIDPRWFGPATGKIGVHQAKFWLESLREFSPALNARNIPLVVRTDRDPAATVLAVAKEAGAERITFNKEYEPGQMAMDERLEQLAVANNVTVQSYKDGVVFEEDEIVTGKGTPYSIFTPYKNAYLKKLNDGMAAGGLPPKMRRMPSIATEEIPTVRELGFEDVSLDIAPGERAGAKLLASFCRNRLADYQRARDLPALSLNAGGGTSRLSAHLNAGTVSIRQAMRAALNTSSGEGKAAWIGELIWRDFYRMILFHYPETVSHPFQKQYKHVRWANNPAMIDAWSAGRTGYPLVDAAMKQIRTTGFMHNRLRMITAMFLTKDLDVHWVIGERLFMRWLMDYDQACNVGGWQWAASTGTDAAPYFRVMNPVLQSLRFDAKGEFIRHYLPALANVPEKYIHAPWEMPREIQIAAGCVIGKDYPNPIVDHVKAKALAVDKFRKRSAGHSAEAT